MINVRVFSVLSFSLYFSYVAEDFVTPSSSPPNAPWESDPAEEEEQEEGEGEELSERQISFLLDDQLSAANLYDKIYDRSASRWSKSQV